MKKIILSNQEVKGTKDWLPEEFFIRDYIFSNWKQICLSYGFSQYLTPILENADIYRAKSGEDIGIKELMVFKDQAGRDLAIRPEMTPSISRLVSKIYSSSPKPLKLFSITNFIRNERPQRGRNREFWQLNCDIFGEDGTLSDLETLQLAIDLMLIFNPPKNSFVLKINSRKLIDDLFDLLNLGEDKKISLTRLMDKYEKLSDEEFYKAVMDMGLKMDDTNRIDSFLRADSIDDLVEKLPELLDKESVKEMRALIKQLSDLGYQEYLLFSPSVIRGFDYYDGLIFEIFDNHPENNRAMFGGGRYNGLAEIFGSKSFPAVGFAIGDETFRIFLESWDILPKTNLYENTYFLPLLSESLINQSFSLSKELRAKGEKVEMGLDVTKIGKALEYANKKGVGKIVIFGEDEFAKKCYKIKDMKSGEEQIVSWSF
ncbi:histidine--tRNA ligase [Candidatus Falkowbacteria bacterium HGW-Falkowbacteria-1]|jgi:histidyl-tRNA synthetase|uniref:Histidine--tRNA ligase n=1 Tax=Candidatus Falkowbacteria bacterium HGW-Falkowbacteria-1 TaxID=2013768 RepID=A0A2N2E9T3_9BACT|nr:MAG: histidine--tRNA ligase [Candidatus Falkowbacteria bacterium HGW-Falkowbacteria-1]